MRPRELGPSYGGEIHVPKIGPELGQGPRWLEQSASVEESELPVVGSVREPPESVQVLKPDERAELRGHGHSNEIAPPEEVGPLLHPVGFGEPFEVGVAGQDLRSDLTRGS